MLNGFEDVFRVFMCSLEEEENKEFVCDRLLSYYPKMKVKLSGKVEEHVDGLITKLIEKSKEDRNVLELYKLLKCALLLLLFLESRKYDIVEKSLNPNNYYKPTLYL